jgi:hypothetical protein
MMPLTRENVLDPSKKKGLLLRLFLYANAWALSLGLLAVITSISYFIDPDTLLKNNALGESLRNWAYAWNVLYFFGGMGMVVGLVKRSRPIDMAGLIFMAGALIINAFAILAIRGGAAAASAPALIALALAALARVRYLYVIGRL